MQKDIGHHSWWYSNRGSEDCIKCKLYPFIDIEKLKDLLPERTKAVIEVLDIDINAIIDRYVWDTVVPDAREAILETLKEKYDIVDIEYVGRSGGWACIQYNFDIATKEGYTAEDDLEDMKYSDLKELLQKQKKAYQTINSATADYIEAYERLEKELDTEEYYIDEVIFQVKMQQGDLLEKLDEFIKKGENLKTL